MPKFRKRPVVIEAVQFLRGEPVPDGVRFCGHDNDEVAAQPCCLGGLVDTLEGPHVASYGDWIITGVKGERYPCKPDIFAMTYEPVED